MCPLCKAEMRYDDRGYWVCPADLGEFWPGEKPERAPYKKAERELVYDLDDILLSKDPYMRWDNAGLFRIEIIGEGKIFPSVRLQESMEGLDKLIRKVYSLNERYGGSQIN